MLPPQVKKILCTPLYTYDLCLPKDELDLPKDELDLPKDELDLPKDNLGC